MEHMYGGWRKLQLRHGTDFYQLQTSVDNARENQHFYLQHRPKRFSAENEWKIWRMEETTTQPWNRTLPVVDLHVDIFWRGYMKLEGVNLN